MAQPSSDSGKTLPPNEDSISVPIIGPQFCASYHVDLVIRRNALSLKDGSVVVTDASGNILFSVKGKLMSLHHNRILLDGDDNPLVIIRRKVCSPF